MDMLSSVNSVVSDLKRVKSRESIVGVAQATGRAKAAAAAAKTQAQPGARSEPQCGLLSDLIEFCGEVPTMRKEASCESMAAAHPCINHRSWR